MDGDTTVEITAEEAIAAARAAAFTCEPEPEAATCGHPGCTDHPGEGRKIIHSRRGGLGADWDLADVEQEIANAQRVAWIDGFLGHELAVVPAEGSPINFEVKRPDRGQ